MIIATILANGWHNDLLNYNDLNKVHTVITLDKYRTKILIKNIFDHTNLIFYE